MSAMPFSYANIVHMIEDAARTNGLECEVEPVDVDGQEYVNLRVLAWGLAAGRVGDLQRCRFVAEAFRVVNNLLDKGVPNYVIHSAVWEGGLEPDQKYFGFVLAPMNGKDVLL